MFSPFVLNQAFQGPMLCLESVAFCASSVLTTCLLESIPIILFDKFHSGEELHHVHLKFIKFKGREFDEEKCSHFQHEYSF